MAINHNSRVKDKFIQPEIEMDLYNFNAKPIKKPLSVDAPKDVFLENGDIKKEALERLTKSFMSDKLHSVMMRMAKYIFIAIAWPPYALLFELPKWVFLKLTPILQKFSTTIVNKIKKQLESLTSVILPVFTHIQKVVVQMAMPVIRFTQKVKELFKKVSLKTQVTFHKTVNSFKKVLSLRTYTQAIAKLATTVREKAKAITHTLRRPFEKLAKLDVKNIISKIMPTQIMQKISEVPSLFLGWAAQLTMVQHTILKFAQAQNLAEQGTTKFLKVLSSTVVTPLAFLVQSLKIASMRVGSLFKSYLRKGYDFFGGKAKELGEWIIGKTKVLFQVETWKKIFPPFLFSWIPRFIREAIVRFLRWLWALPITQSIVEGASKGCQEVITLPAKIKKGIVEKVKEVISHAKNARQSIKEKCVAGANKFGWFCNRLVYWTLTVIIMTGIIADWGVQLLGRISNKVFRKNLFNIYD